MDDRGVTSGSFPADPGGVRSARVFVADTLSHLGAPRFTVDDFSLVVGELGTNLVEYQPDAGTFGVAVIDAADAWCVEMTSPAPDPSAPVWFPDRWGMASPLSPSGRGLGIVARLMDEITATGSDGRLVTRCRRYR